MKTFWIRTASAAVYALLFIGTMYSGTLLHNQDLGVLIFMAFLLFVAVGSTFELFRIIHTQGSRPNQLLGYACAALTVLAFSLVTLKGHPLTGFQLMTLFLVFLPVLAALAVIAQLWGHSERPFADAAYTLLPVTYIGFPLGVMPMLHVNYNVLMMVVLLVWVNDCFAYMGGSLFGRHKLWVRHSPGKTWEGSLCGMLFCLATALFIGPLFETKLLWFDWLALGLICSVVATLGDLAESMLKRSVGLKDSGNIMPGHGGFLDRFDSLLIIMPFVFAYVTLRIF